MSDNIIWTAHRFNGETDLAELGEDHPWVKETDAMIKIIMARLERGEAKANSPQTKRRCYELRQAIGDALHDTSWGAHVAGAELAFAEYDVRPVVRRAS